MLSKYIAIVGISDFFYPFFRLLFALCGFFQKKEEIY